MPWSFGSFCLSHFPPFHSNRSWCVTLQKSHPCKYRHTFLLLNNGTFFSLHVLLVFTKLYFQDLELNHLRPGPVWLTGSKKENLNLKECLGNKKIWIKTPEYLRNVYISWVCMSDKKKIWKSLIIKNVDYWKSKNSRALKNDKHDKKITAQMPNWATWEY